jgi:hypothetical protein
MSRIRYDNQDILTKYNSGMSRKEITETVGITERCLRELLKRHGVKLEPKLSESTITHIVNMASDGKKCVDIAKHTGLNRSTVGKVLRANGFKLRDNPEKRNQMVWDMYVQGYSYEQMEEKLGIPSKKLWQIIYSLKRRDHYAKKTMEVKPAIHAEPPKKKDKTNIKYTPQTVAAMNKLKLKGHHIEPVKNSNETVFLNGKLTGVGNLYKIAYEDNPRLQGAIF